ncbi:methyltransferase domain-containing protein [Calidifontibacter sp. DB0510]|uniref:Methyltransferase domain-containing protein n=1 Tax=Metallococcus carri TaxID=1656884 RepID=A0A967E8T8_9MICO|nr:class I SAM-dependent methyltransferase [Metallococcus carri]NHN54525.1 methyltransferase domain-containing protein [Metallococcus carri]NOP36636.1 methyltransferase domain-containing protein [Calidifontibacter sp. DB2511S]
MTYSLGEVIETLFGADLPFEIRAYDGSRAGRVGSPYVVTLRNQRAVRYLATAPGEMGFARAYVMGDLDVEGIDKGDPYDFLKGVLGDFSGTLKVRRPTAAQLREIVKAVGPGAFNPPPIPSVESAPTWRRMLEGLRHSRRRDADAIQHHYDVGNEFYELVLGPSMTYTCAAYPSADATLEEAQAHKYDLVCRKLGLQPGMRLLDVGSGWGGMVRHAVQHYGVTALGVTLSREQATWAQERIKTERLDDRAEVRHLDYRDVTETDFDAISSIGLTEHIGVKNYPAYFQFLYAKVRPGGRMLNHCITRPDTTSPALERAGFINRYVFPDGELTGVGKIVEVMQNTGFEIRHVEDLREHYARTTRAWAQNLSANWDECVRLAGEPIAKVWGLYLTGSSLGFERNNIQLHQVLGQKLDDQGVADYPLRPDFG